MAAELTPTRLRRRRRAVSVLPGVALLVASASILVSVLLFARVTDQSDQIALASVRNCVTGNINSAVVKFNAQDPRLGESPSHYEKRVRYAKLYAIVDCKSSQTTGSTIILSPKQTSRYIEFVTEGRAPIILRGKVTGSRPTVLKGVKTFKDLGHQ